MCAHSLSCNVTLLLLVLASGILAIIPLQWLPSHVAWAQYMDLLHPIAGFLLSLWLAIIGRAQTWWSLTVVGLTAVTCAVMVEVIHGAFGRNASASDFVLSAAGISAALLFCAFRLRKIGSGQKKVQVMRFACDAAPFVSRTQDGET